MSYKLFCKEVGYLDECNNFIGERRFYDTDGSIMIHCFHDENGFIYGEYRRWCSGILMSWSLDEDGSELLNLDPKKPDDPDSLEKLTKMARERGLPLLSDIPTDDEGRVIWALKYPNLPVIPRSVNIEPLEYKI